MKNLSHVPQEFRFGIINASDVRAQSSDTHGLAVGAHFVCAEKIYHHSAANTMCAGTHHHEKRAAMGHYRKEYIPHAEVVLISQLAERGYSTAGGTIYTTLSPCAPCVNSIVHAGIRQVVIAGDPYRKDNETFASIVLGRTLLQENNIEYLDFSLNGTDADILALLGDDRRWFVNVGHHGDGFIVRCLRGGVDVHVTLRLSPLVSSARVNNQGDIAGERVRLNQKGDWYLTQHLKTMEIFNNVRNHNERVSGYICP